MEWRGGVSPRHMPTVVNPSRGFITNWNNKPIAGWPVGEQREQWGVVDRVQVFIDALESARAAGRRLGVGDVKDLMRRAATSDIFAARIVPFLEDAASTLDQLPTAPLPSAVAHVRAWVDAGAPLVGVPDRDGVIPDPGAAIYTEFRAAAQAAVFADELGSAFRGMLYPALNEGNQEDDHGSFGSPDALFLRVLHAAGPVAGVPAPPGLLPPSRGYFDDAASGASHTRTEVLLAALDGALGALTTRFGTADQSQWQMPALQESYMDLGAIGGVFGATVMERENRGSFNVVAELGRPVRGEIIVPPGEAGTFTGADLMHEPPHLRDQLRVYEAFEYRAQPFTESELEPPVTMETIAVLR
jgi:penicillin amidase